MKIKYPQDETFWQAYIFAVVLYMFHYRNVTFFALFQKCVKLIEI